nr:Cna B-type domain-containing protein [Hydrogenoanaerobacterium saccharovorans]
MLGRELEYRWVECGVYQGKSEENLLRDDGTFTLQQNGYSVNYQSSSVQQDGSSTLITNTLDNSLDYLVAKDWQDEQGQPMQAPAGETVTLQIFQGLPGEPLDPDPYVEITLDGAADPAPTVVNADLGITVQETEPWKGEVRNLPEFDSSGRQYEYYLLEEGDGVSRFPIYETERTEDGGYQTRVINVPRGAGNRIMVRKVWIDDSDTTHRLPVTIQAYAKENNKEISSVTLRDGVWYDYIGIGSYTADEVYILETNVGTNRVPLTTYYMDVGSANYDNPAQPDEYDKYAPDDEYTAIQYETEYHRYEATYSRDTIAGTEFLTVTNRRLGNIDLTVTKQWLDGGGGVREELLAELEKTQDNADPADQLYLAIRLDLVGGEDYYAITRNGPDTPDTITVGNPDNQVAILDQNGNRVSSVQVVSLKDSTTEYYFHNLPKYDRSGQVVHYTAVEVWVDGSGRELSRTELAQKFPDAYALIRSYSTGYSDEKYLVGELHDSDSQTMTVTNRLSGTKSVLWHKQWKDTYNYENGLRPDIYLDIYQVTHVRDNQGKPTTQVSLYQANYHWTYLEDDVGNGDQLLSPIYHWHAVFSSLPKYDSLGYEIYYYAVENTHVNAADFDYLDTAISYTLEGVLTEVGTQSAIDPGPIPTDEDGTPVAVLIPDGQSDAGRYALLEDGTFTNTASANVTVLGQKLWKTMPASYPAADLPEVTFTLQQTLGTETKDIATLTIRSWNLPVEDGAFHFGIAYTGANVVTVADDGSLKIEPAPGNDNAQPLPKYNADGERYTYTLKETAITLENRTGSKTDSKLVYLDPVINTYLVENGYRSIQGALSVKKFLQLPTDENGDPTAYPAVQFTLDRRYTRNNGSPSDWEEEVQTVTWTSAEVQEASKAAQDKTAPLENVLTFKNLDYYAPNGSRWEYRIREVTDGWLGGYEITAEPGDIDITQITTDYNAENGIAVNPDDITLNESGDNAAVAASFYNKPDDTRETVTLEFDKVWDDFGDAFRTRPDELTLTVQRQAHAQEGQDNAILPQTVDSSLYNIAVEVEDDDDDTWHYTITGTEDGELERYAPNGMPWIYRIVEEEPSGYESASGGETWTTGDPVDGVLTAGDLTNSITQTVYYRKQWLNSDSTAVTEDYLGTEITVTFQLQVWNDTASQWENGDTFFQHALDSENYTKLFGSYDFTPELTGRINDSTVWGKNHSFTGLPRFISDRQGGTTQLSYRVVETGISWDGGSQITVSVENDSKDSWQYRFTWNGAGTSPFSPKAEAYTSSIFTIQNYLNTTSITVRKEWDGDQDNAYGTRPTTGRDDYNWEVSLLVQYSTDDANWKTLTTYETVKDPDTQKPITIDHPVILHVYGVNEQDVSTANATLSGLPTHDLEGNEFTYRVRELQPDAEDNTRWYSEVNEITVEEAEDAIADENGTFHHNYTANYTADNGTLVAKNTYGSLLQFTAQKTWHGTPADSLTLELQYLKEIGADGKEVWASFPTPATVELDGTAGPKLTDPYYENTPAGSAVWTAVWEKVPTVMPGSVTGNDRNTRYRIAETVPGGYQTVDGSPTWQEVTADNPEATFTNVKSTSLTVEKKWGTSLAATSLPASITVQLYSSTNPEDAEKGNTADRLKVEGKTLILRNPNPASANWTGSFTNLPLYTADGDPIYYYAKEIQIAGKDLVKAADGCYLVTIGSKEYHFRFSFDTTTTGSYKTTLVNVEYSDITGTKTWKDNSDDYDTRPDGITLALYRKAGTGTEEVVNGADGKPLQPTWVKSGNTWTYTYTHLPQANAQGETYTYRVEEIQTTGPAGGDQYTATQNGMNLTNTLTGTVDLQVEKLWQDNDNALGLRPDEIIVELCVNGSPDPARTLTLTAANDWKGSFDGLAKYDSNGALIRYSVREESQSMPLGYRVYYGEAVTGTPESNEEPVYQFTNVADGAVTLTKKVSGSRGDTSKAFTFTFTLTSGLPSTAPADAYPYTITRQDGTPETGVIRSGETFTLRHNESITISELPGNAAYQFTESDNTGYQVSSTGASGTVLPGSTISASFENYRGGGGGGGHDPDPDPRHDHPTPSPDPELPYTGQDWRTVGLLSAGGVILLSLGLLRRRKDHEPSQPE